MKTVKMILPLLLCLAVVCGCGKKTPATGKIEFSGKEYIPDFTYCLVDNHKYSNKELLERKDEMSLIMLLNKIQLLQF